MSNNIPNQNKRPYSIITKSIPQIPTQTVQSVKIEIETENSKEFLPLGSATYDVDDVLSPGYSDPETSWYDKLLMDDSLDSKPVPSEKPKYEHIPELSVEAVNSLEFSEGESEHLLVPPLKHSDSIASINTSESTRLFLPSMEEWWDGEKIQSENASDNAGKSKKLKLIS
ncbi:hypothetical protein HK096_005261, partial [Nowakowskiella sp. JEL0078]